MSLFLGMPCGRSSYVNIPSGFILTHAALAITVRSKESDCGQIIMETEPTSASSNQSPHTTRTPPLQCSASKAGKLGVCLNLSLLHLTLAGHIHLDIDPFLLHFFG